MALHEPERHEPLVEERWSADRVAAAIDHIVARSRDAYEANDLRWPTHPNDVGPLAPAPSPGLYFGGAGIVWALAQLGVRLPNVEAALDRDIRETTANVAASEPDYRRGLLLGLAGPLAVASLLTRDAQPADALHALVRDNQANRVLEFMWGAPGTMLAALAMHGATRENRWRAAFREGALELERSLSSAPTGARLWEQNLYGSLGFHVGAVHGFAGNLAPILAGKHLLADDVLGRFRALAIETTKATAIVEDGTANWPPSVGGGRPGRDKILVQVCHGAPGMIVALGELADGSDRDFDALLLAGGELTWRAGPLAKGAGLCHGTAGNGYAFLRLFAQTRDERWLTRARAFAMHALRQSERAEREHGDIRHSLWTGDIGVALYLRACETIDPRYPTLNYI